MASPTKYRVKITPLVLTHLQDIFAYIEQHSPQNASQMIERLLDGVDSLEMFPHRFKVVQNSAEVGAEVRSMPIKPFPVRYYVDDAQHVVTVLSVRHGARLSE